MKKTLSFCIIYFIMWNWAYNVDVLTSGGVIHDGTGMTGYVGNVAINNDTIFM